MKIVARRGITDDPQFIGTFMSADGIVAEIRKYFDDAAQGKNQRLLEACTQAASAAGSSSSGSSMNRDAFRNVQEGSVSKARVASATSSSNWPALQARDVSNIERRLGVLLWLSYSSSQVTEAHYQAPLQEAYAQLQTRVSQEVFQFLDVESDVNNNDDSPLMSFDRDSDDQGDEILDTVTLAPFSVVERMIGANTSTKASNILLPALQKDLPKFYAPFGTLQVPSLIVREALPTWLQTALNAANFDLSSMPPHLLWIPDQMAALFHDSVEDTVVYRLDSVKPKSPAGRPRYVAALRGEVYTCDPMDKTLTGAKGLAALGNQSRPFYGILEGKLWSAPLMIPVDSWPREGVGGQGAMRCDRPSEFRASVLDWGGLGRALGLTAGLGGQGSRFTQSVHYKDRSLAHQRLAYRKVYDPNAVKKNLPKDTRPVTFETPELENSFNVPPAMLRANDRARAREMMKVSGLEMKQKGEDAAGLPVGKATAARKAANAVMRDALRARFGKQIGDKPLGNNWPGDATTFAATVFAVDPVAREFWAQESFALVLADGKTAAKAEQRSVLRTAQEWCHLFGHGEGGREVPDNFVCGSKHCNSEQLALELAQRLYRDNGLTVKITAYLMPSGLPVQASNWTALQEAFKNLPAEIGQIIAEVPTTVEARASRDVRLKAALALYYKNYVGQQNSVSISYQTSAGETIILPGFGEQAMSDAVAEDAAQTFAKRIASALFPVAPIAYIMRYKVYVDATGAKPVDHVYSGQREEMDFNEFQLLQWAFRLRIAAAIDGPQQSGKQGPLHAELTRLLDEKIAAL